MSRCRVSLMNATPTPPTSSGTVSSLCQSILGPTQLLPVPEMTSGESPVNSSAARREVPASENEAATTSIAPLAPQKPVSPPSQPAVEPPRPAQSSAPTGPCAARPANSPPAVQLPAHMRAFTARTCDSSLGVVCAYDPDPATPRIFAKWGQWREQVRFHHETDPLTSRRWLSGLSASAGWRFCRPWDKNNKPKRGVLPDDALECYRRMDCEPGSECRTSDDPCTSPSVEAETRARRAKRQQRADD